MAFDMKKMVTESADNVRPHLATQEALEAALRLYKNSKSNQELVKNIIEMSEGDILLAAQYVTALRECIESHLLLLGLHVAQEALKAAPQSNTEKGV